MAYLTDLNISILLNVCTLLLVSVGVLLTAYMFICQNVSWQQAIATFTCCMRRVRSAFPRMQVPDEMCTVQELSQLPAGSVILLLLQIFKQYVEFNNRKMPHVPNGVTNRFYHLASSLPQQQQQQQYRQRLPIEDSVDERLLKQHVYDYPRSPARRVKFHSDYVNMKPQIGSNINCLPSCTHINTDPQEVVIAIDDDDDDDENNQQQKC